MKWTAIAIALLLLAAASCGGPTWYEITREVAAADQALEAGDAAGAAARYQAADAALEGWLASNEGRALYADLEAGRVRLGRWTLEVFRTRVLPRAEILAGADDDPLAAAFVQASRLDGDAPRVQALMAVAVDFARAGRHSEAMVVLGAVNEEMEALSVPPNEATLLLVPGFADLACQMEDEAMLAAALLGVSSPAGATASDGALLEHVIGGTAEVLAKHGRCEEAGALVERLAIELEASWADPDPCGEGFSGDAPPSWNTELLEQLKTLSDLCREAGDIDGARNLLDASVVRAEAEGDEALLDLGEAYVEVGLPGEAAALAGSVDDPRIREQLLLAAVAAWPAADAGQAAPVQEDVIGWLEAAEGAAAAAKPIQTAQALLLEVADRWEALGELERAAAARARAASINMQLDP